MNRVILIDAYSQIFRGFHAIAGLTTAAGEPVNAIFALARLLLKLHADYPSPQGAAVFDCGRVQFRLALHPDYKANRPPMPEELKVQLPALRELFSAFGWPLLEEPEYEADDLIAALAQRLPGPVRIVSSDKDLAQLVTADIALLAPAARGGFELRDAEAVKTRYGLPPDRIVDYLALLGDHADNIPGVPGIGPKTAVRLLTEYGPLPELLAAPERLENPKWREKLESHRELIRRNLELIRLRRDLPERLTGDELRRREPDWPRLLELCERYELRSITREVRGFYPEDDLFAPPPPAKPTPPAPPPEPDWIQDELF